MPYGYMSCVYGGVQCTYPHIWVWCRLIWGDAIGALQRPRPDQPGSSFNAANYDYSWGGVGEYEDKDDDDAENEASVISQEATPLAHLEGKHRTCYLLLTLTTSFQAIIFTPSLVFIIQYSRVKR